MGKNGKKSANSLNKHRLRETRRSMQRTERNRPENRSKNQRTSPAPHQTSARASFESAIRRRDSYVGQVGNAHPQTPLGYRLRRTRHEKNYAYPCARRSSRNNRTHLILLAFSCLVRSSFPSKQPPSPQCSRRTPNPKPSCPN